MSELFNGAEFHEISGVFALDSSGNADIDHVIFASCLKVFGLGLEEGMEL